MGILSDEQLQALNAAHKKVRVLAWDEHEIVLRRATRDEVRLYRERGEELQTKTDRVDQLAQTLIVAFDGETDPTKARVAFTSAFLEEYPGFTSAHWVAAVVSYLCGMVEEKDAADFLGVASARNAALASLRKGSPNGPAPSPTTASHPPMVLPRPVS